MNKILFIIFIILFALFIFFMVLLGKGSIKTILSTYFRNYYSNSFEEKDRKFNIASFLILGLLPYALGAILFFSFENFFENLNTDLLFQMDVIFLTIFCLFIGFDFKKEGKEIVKKELIATLLVNILLVIVSVTCLLVASSFVITSDSPDYFKYLKATFYSIYFAFNFKIIIMFFYSLKRVFILSLKD